MRSDADIQHLSRRCLPISPNLRVSVRVMVRIRVRITLHHALRHDVLSTSVSNNFVHVRRIGIRQNGAEPSRAFGAEHLELPASDYGTVFRRT